MTRPYLSAEDACLGFLMSIDDTFPGLSNSAQRILLVHAVESALDQFVAEGDREAEEVCRERLRWIEAHLPR